MTTDIDLIFFKDSKNLILLKKIHQALIDDKIKY